MRIVDSTRYTTLFNCPRERYWLTEYKGRGITLSSPNEDQCYGLAVHKGCELIAGGESFETAWAEAEKELNPLDQSALTPDGLSHLDELKALLYGHLRCYEEYILPQITRDYDIVGIEQEIIVPLNEDVQYCTRLDKILRSKESGLLYNMNYKTTSYLNDLRSSLEYSMQLMMEAEAARMAMGANVSGSIVLGFDKGSKRAVSAGEKKKGLTGKRILSPYTYAYYKGGEDDPWDPLSIQYSVEYRNGWTRFGVFDSRGGTLLDCCDKWWNMLDERIKMGTFSILPPIYHSEEVIENLKKQIISMENLFQADPIDIEEIPGMLDIVFPQNLKNCNQHAGFIHHTCPYKPLCWDNEEPEVLIGGLYKWREINHPYEDQFVAHPEHEMVA